MEDNGTMFRKALWQLLALGSIFILGSSLIAAQQAGGANYAYDDGNQITKVIDSHGSIVEYIYDPSGNLLEIRRTTITGLAILGFTPLQGPVSTTVTIQGRGFNSSPAANDVRFNGTAATVLSSSSSLLTVEVPAGAMTGFITVTIGAETATSSEPFTVVASPVVTDLSPHLATSNDSAPVVSSLQVTGVNLTDSTFSLLPEIVPLALTIDSTSIDPSGTSATLGITIAAEATGFFTLVATNGAGSSSAFPSPSNTITILEGALDPDGDGLTNAQEVSLGTDPLRTDTDGDEFRDGDEVAAGSNPLNPQSTPASFAYAVVSILNRTDPGAGAGVATSGPLSVFNRTDPSARAGTLIAPPVSVFNVTAPQGYAAGPDVSVNNVPP